MGSKEECPVCKSYSSTIYSAFENGDPCPCCLTSLETIYRLKEIELERKANKRKEADEALIEENASLKRDLVLKHEKYRQMKNLLWDTFSKLEYELKDLQEFFYSKKSDWEEEGKE